MSEEEEEDHEFAQYGTLLDPIEEDEVQARKPISVQDQIATDKHGKRRFHGAFTGGFSAGFCNSVGSLEGWTPATFKSSRSEKVTAQQTQQKPEDFMDDEDISEFGIAPKFIQVSSRFEGNKGEGSRKYRSFEGAHIPGVPVLETLLQPALDTIGSKLLRRMGWKPGQGVGPRLSAKDKRALATRESNRSKIYGCARPSDLPTTDSSDQGLGNQETNESNDEDEEYDHGFTYAPDEYLPYLVKPKDNEFGLGYKGLDKRPVLSNEKRGFNLFDVGTEDTGVTFIGRNNKKVKIHGQAFGVGAFEAEDEDIYALEDMSRYDTSLAPTGSRTKTSRPRNHQEKRAPSDEDIVEGFRPSSSASLFTKVYPPPVLPHDYTPRPPALASQIPLHHPPLSFNTNQIPTQFQIPSQSQVPSQIQIPPQGDHPIKQAKSAFERAAILDEPLPIPTRVPARDEPEICRHSRFSQSNISSQPSSGSSQEQTNLQGQPTSQGQDSKVTSGQGHASDGAIFRPFASDAEKQKRYEQFVVFLKLGVKDKLASIQPSSMTDWEKQREVSEFTAAQALYSPLSGIMADRFTRGSQPDDTNPLVKVEKTLSSEDEILKNAAENKMYGKLTRDTSVWMPSDLLCKRFNIKPPVFDYRNPSAQKKRGRNTNHSLFEFLNAPSTSSNSLNPSTNALNPSSESFKHPSVSLDPSSQTNTPLNRSSPCGQFGNLASDQSGSPVSSVKGKLPNPFRESEEVQQSSRLEDIPLTTENKVDLFRAIFLSDEEDETGDQNKDKEETSEKQVTDEDKNKEDEPKEKLDTNEPSNQRGEDNNRNNEELSNTQKHSDRNLVKEKEIQNQICDKTDKSNDANNPMQLIDKATLKTTENSLEPNGDDFYGPTLPGTTTSIVQTSSSLQSREEINEQTQNNLGNTQLGENTLELTIKSEPNDCNESNAISINEELRKSKIRNTEVVGIRFERPSKKLHINKTSNSSNESRQENLELENGQTCELIPKREMEDEEWVDVDEAESDRDSDGKRKRKAAKKDEKDSKRGRLKDEKGRNLKCEKRRKSKRRNSSSSDSDCDEPTSKSKSRKKSSRRKRSIHSDDSSCDDKRHKSKRNRHSSSSPVDHKRHKSKRKHSSDSDEKRHKSKKKSKKHKR